MSIFPTLLLLSLSYEVQEKCFNIASADDRELCSLVYKNAEDFDIKNDLGPGPLKKTGHDHITYRIVASRALGANATNLDQQYGFESKGLDPALTSKGFITAENWKDHLGEHVANTSYHYSDYLDFFRTQLLENGFQKTFDMSWHILANGVAGDLFHSLIQLSYAFEGKESLMRLEIVAEGLAWLSTSFCAYAPLLLNDGQSDSIMHILKNLGDDHSLPKFDEQTHLLDRMKALVTRAGILASYDIDAHSTSTYEVALAALHVFATTNYSDFFILHLLTSSRAMDTVAVALESHDAMNTARKRHWRAFLYWYTAYNRPKLPTTIESIYLQHMPSWKELSQRCIEIFPGDSHLVKLVHLAKDFASRYENDSTLWKYMALQVIQRFENGSGWSGLDVFTAPIEPVVCA